MKKTFLLLPIAAVWFGCAKDNHCPGPDTGTRTIGITSVIANATVVPGSRTVITGSSATWQNGDVLGLFCPQAMPSPAVNDSFTVSGLPSSPVWTPGTTIYWANGTLMHTFLAYAPYASGNTDTTAVKLPALNVQTGTVNPAQDFLISSNRGGSGGLLRSAGNVGLVFTHALSLLEFDVTVNSSIGANTTLSGLTLSGGSSDKLFTTDGTSTINLSTGVITPGPTANTITATPGTPPLLGTTAKAFYVILLPGTVTTPTLTFSIKEDGATNITLPVASIPTLTMNPGSKYTYAVSISRTAITISNPTITDWTNVNGSPVNVDL